MDRQQRVKDYEHQIRETIEKGDVEKLLQITSRERIEHDPEHKENAAVFAGIFTGILLLLVVLIVGLAGNNIGLP